MEYLENILEFLGTKYPKLPVKMGSLHNKQLVETLKMGDYYERVMATYSYGTYRCGPLNNITLVRIIYLFNYLMTLWCVICLGYEAEWRG